MLKLVEVQNHSWSDCTKDKVRTRVHIENEGGMDLRYQLSLSVLLTVRADFNPDEEIGILRDTDSYQIRPKALYRSESGIYVKLNGKRMYFSREQMDSMRYQELGKYLPDEYFGGKPKEEIKEAENGN